MWANRPKMAREWTKKYGSKIQPSKKKKKKGGGRKTKKR
jgi:hypothetical protein